MAELLRDMRVMFLKLHRVRKHGKVHRYYSLCESVRVNRRRVTQRRVLHLGELNTDQVESWQRSIDVVQEDGRRRQMRLFADSGSIPQGDDVAEVILSSLSLRNARRFGDCWLGCRLWEELALGEFWRTALFGQRGAIGWEKVIELLAVNRLIAPRSELFIHEKWYPQTAMGFLLGVDARVADEDRLYRALDRMLPHKESLQKHLTERWQNLFGIKIEVLLYDLTSTYFEGQAEAIPKAQRGYSRDHRSDCKQVLLALIVTPEGFPLSYEIFPGNRNDVTTLEHALSSIEEKYGSAQRVWVFDRGIVSENNLKVLSERGAKYLVGTPRSALKTREAKLLHGDWHKISEEVTVQLLPEDGETYVLARSTARAQKESAMRMRELKGLMKGLIKLRKAVRKGTLIDEKILAHRLGRLHERYPGAWRYGEISANGLVLTWRWDREALRRAALRDGAYLLRTNLTDTDPQKLWQQYIQLTEVEAAFRTLKSELAIRPIWHRIERRVEAHIMVAFLGYCLWVSLKHKLRRRAPSLTSWQCLALFSQIQLVEVWFKLRDGRSICLERITQPTQPQAVVLNQLDITLPRQPPPKIYPAQCPPIHAAAPSVCGQPRAFS